MTVNSTSSSAGQPAAADAVATPLTQLDRKQRDKVTSELRRIHDLVSNVDEIAHKDKCADKADRACALDFKPQRD